jgi:GxxExxY protein
MALEHEELTGKIISAAIKVHTKLGPGFVESVYENALVVELGKMGLKVGQQVEVEIRYEGVQVGKHRLDLLVEDAIVVENKTVKNFEPIHFAVVRSYLKASGKDVGLLFNFAGVTLEAKRVFLR